MMLTPQGNLARHRSARRAQPPLRFRAWRSGPGSTRPPSTRASGPPSRASRAGPARRACPRSWTPPAPRWRDFVGLIDESGDGRPPPARRVRCLSLGQMEREQAFDPAGFPQAGPWEDIEFPSINDDSAYAIELDRDVMPPVLRAGDMLIISPSSSVRRHDRVMVRHRSGRGRARRAAATHGAADHAGPFPPARRGARDRRRRGRVAVRASFGSANRKWPPASRRPGVTGRHHNVREEEPDPRTGSLPGRADDIRFSRQARQSTYSPILKVRLMPEQCANGRSGAAGISQGRGRSSICERRPEPAPRGPQRLGRDAPP